MSGGCYGLFQGMGDEVAALVVVIDAAVMRMWANECMNVRAFGVQLQFKRKCVWIMIK